MSKAGKRYMQLQYLGSQERIKEHRWYVKFWLAFFGIFIGAIAILAYLQIWSWVFVLIGILVVFCFIWVSLS